MKRPGGSDAASTYWQSVEQAALSANEVKSRRANELLRLRGIANWYRGQWFKDQPELTIDADDSMGGRANAAVSKLGGWGQGLSIKIKASRIDPFHWTPAVDKAPAMAIPAKDRSLIFGQPLRRNSYGEALRRFEADLIVMQQMLRAEQHRTVEAQLNGHGAAKSDINSWGGFGDWYANQASNLWMKWCEQEGYPFVPVRHSRSGYEEQHSCIAAYEDEQIDGILTKFRPSCSGWPMVALSQARDPIAEGDHPPQDAPEITQDVWDRWKQEQCELTTALTKQIGKETMLLGVAWPQGQLPQIDEVEGEPLVQMPAVTPAIAMSRRIPINFEATEALQSVESLFTEIDRNRGTKLWREFLQVAADHPESPKATMVQGALSVDDQVALRTGRAMETTWGRKLPTPIEGGEPMELVELKDSKFQQLVTLRNSIALSCEGLNDDREHDAIEALRLMGMGDRVPSQDQIWDWAELEPEHVHSSKAEAQWAHLFNGGHPRAQVIKRDGGWIAAEPEEAPPLEPSRRQIEIDLATLFGVPTSQTIAGLAQLEHLFTPIEAGDKPGPAADPKSEDYKPKLTELNGFEVLQAVTHKLHGQGVITHLWKSLGLGNAGIDFDGKIKIVGLKELTPIEAGGLSKSELEQGADLRVDNPTSEIESIDSTPDNPEPSQSQLRKQPDLPEWPENTKSLGQGLRVRHTKEQRALVIDQIKQRLEQGMRPGAIATELHQWCGQTESAVMSTIRRIRTRIEAGQEVAA